MVERKTAFMIIEKLQHGKNAQELAKVVIGLLFAYKINLTLLPVTMEQNLQTIKLLQKNSKLTSFSQILMLPGKRV